MITICPNPESLARAATDLFVEQAKLAIAARGRFAVSLSGGTTPKRVYELLAQPPYRDQVAWSQVHLFWGDERCVPPDDPRSNTHMTRLALLDHVPIPASQVHPIDGNLPPSEAAASYEAVLRTFFKGESPCFDLIFLGMGEDGHTASLFPGTPALTEKNRWVTDIHVPAHGFSRITLTTPVLNQGHVVAFLITGANKAEVLREVIEGDHTRPRYPSQLIRPAVGELRWLLDTEAAGQLKKPT